jgi:putative nucleotidyltransferase with HDIG domain
MINENLNNIPSEEECFRLIKKYDMFPNIIDHSVQVKNVTEAIYKNLIDKTDINMELLRASALLHDITKTKSIQEKELRHDLTGGELLRKLGYEEIAVIVENHVVFSDFDNHGPLLEKEIIYYADKRVMHDKIVNIDTRVTDLVERYGRTEKIKEMILHNKKFILKLESKIQKHMNIPIEEALNGL